MRNVALAVTILAALATAQIPTEGLVARYDFTSGSLEDGSPNSRDLENWLGTAGVATTVDDRDTVPYNAYQWRGSLSKPFKNDNDEGMPIGNTDRSVCFWLSLLSWDSCQHIVSWGSDRQGGNIAGSFKIVFKNDTLSLLQGDTRHAKYKVKSSQFPANGIGDERWTFVAITIESGTVKWYVDSVANDGITCALTNVATLQFPEMATSTGTDTRLVVGGGEGGRFLKGKLDDILIYDRALSDLEINDIYKPTVNVCRTSQSIRTNRRVTPKRGLFSLNGRLVTEQLKPGFTARILYK